jgi:hypothetical protein
MLPTVNVIYLRTDHKLIPVFLSKRKKEKEWEGSGKISKLKKQFSTGVTNSTAQGF